MQRLLLIGILEPTPGKVVLQINPSTENFHIDVVNCAHPTQTDGATISINNALTMHDLLIKAFLSRTNVHSVEASARVGAR